MCRRSLLLNIPCKIVVIKTKGIVELDPPIERRR